MLCNVLCLSCLRFVASSVCLSRVGYGTVQTYLNVLNMKESNNVGLYKEKRETRPTIRHKSGALDMMDALIRFLIFE